MKTNLEHILTYMLATLLAVGYLAACRVLVSLNFARCTIVVFLILSKVMATLKRS